MLTTFLRQPSLPVIALLSAALFGLATPFSKLLLGAVEPWLLAGLLYLGAGLGLGAISLLQRMGGQRPRETPLARGDLLWLSAAILFGGVIAPVLLMLGLNLTSASAGSLLLNLEVIATIGVAALIFREHVSMRLLLGTAFILAGAVALSWQGGGFALDTGSLLITGACLAWGLDNNMTRKVSGADPIQITMLRGLVAGGVNVTIGLMMGAAMPGAAVLGGAMLTGLLGYGISLVLFVVALRHLGAARTGAYFSTAPFMGAFASILLLGDPVTAQLLTAGALMAVGVWLNMSEQHQHPHSHEVLTHSHWHRHDAHHQHTDMPEHPPGEPHGHVHRHEPQTHAHAHWPDLHHRHGH